VKPVLQALVLAEHIYQDITGKKVICGTFNQVLFATKPLHQDIKLPDGGSRRIILGGMQGGSPYAYLSLTDVCDNTELILQFVNLTRNQILFANKVALQKVERLSTIELVLPLPHLGIREEGTYAFEVVCEGEIIGSCRIVGKEFEIPSTPPE